MNLNLTQINNTLKSICSSIFSQVWHGEQIVQKTDRQLRTGGLKRTRIYPLVQIDELFKVQHIILLHVWYTFLLIWVKYLHLFVSVNVYTCMYVKWPNDMVTNKMFVGTNIRNTKLYVISNLNTSNLQY